MSFLVQDSNTHLFTYTSSEHLYILVSWGYAYLQILIFIWKTRFLQLALPEMALDFVGLWKSVSQILRSDFTIIYLLVLQVNIFFFCMAEVPSSAWSCKNARSSLLTDSEHPLACSVIASVSPHEILKGCIPERSSLHRIYDLYCFVWYIQICHLDVLSSSWASGSQELTATRISAPCYSIAFVSKWSKRKKHLHLL